MANQTLLKRRQIMKTLGASTLTSLTGGVLASPFAPKAWAKRPMPQTSRVDYVHVRKNGRVMDLVRRDQVLRRYRVALGFDPSGHKSQQGDGRTPEGDYVIDWRLASSRFHLALHISYPNEQDIELAHSQGVSPGGDIMIHGLPNGWGAQEVGHPTDDWTAGCVAVHNHEIEEVWDLVANGTPIFLRA